MPRRPLLIALPLLAACAPARSPGAAAFLEQLERRPDSFVAEVARARNLPVSTPVRILLDDDAAFAAATAELAKRADAVPSAGTTKAFYVAFHFAGQRPAGAQPSSTADEVQEEQLLGFYDDGTRVIHVRKSRLARGAAKDEVEQRFIVGHEVEHALAHQRFGDQLPRAVADDDTRLAKMALLEGDASLGAVLAIAERAHKLPRRVLARASDFVRNGSFDRLAANNDENRALRAAPANEREKLLFPYGAGLALMNDLYRTGGLPLVDAAFSRPPLTTEHVIHPEKYLAGELPVTVRTPPAPPGFEVAVSGHMGELMSGVVLARCVPPADARAAVVGWGGDTYTIGVDTKSRVAVSWSTAWDDEASAARFADTLTKNADCIGAANRSAAWSLEPGMTLAREGTRVGVVLGLAKEAAAPLARDLLALAEPPPRATPPFGPRTLVPMKPRPQASHGRPSFGGWQNDMLGVLVPVWQGFQVSTKPESDSFLMKADKPSFVLVALDLLDEPATKEATERLFGEMETTLAKAGDVEFRRTWQGPTELPLGRGVARQWAVPGTTFAATVAVIPICGGTGAYVVTTAWADAVSNNAVNQWVKGLRRADGEPPACAELDPLVSNYSFNVNGVNFVS